MDGLEFDDELDLDVEPKFDEALGLGLELDTFFALGRGKLALPPEDELLDGLELDTFFALGRGKFGLD